jgi:hypothetical protein
LFFAFFARYWLNLPIFSMIGEILGPCLRPAAALREARQSSRLSKFPIQYQQHAGAYFSS